MPVEYHNLSLECSDPDRHTAFLPALGVRISFLSHQTLVEGVYALYEREYGPNDIRLIYPENCPAKEDLNG